MAKKTNCYKIKINNADIFLKERQFKLLAAFRRAGATIRLDKMANEIGVGPESVLAYRTDINKAVRPHNESRDLIVYKIKRRRADHVHSGQYGLAENVNIKFFIDEKEFDPMRPAEADTAQPAGSELHN